tara:strand:- start:32 stop:256 length:225 start_codon:yes stop_codon:yes gene_type:complete
MSGQAVPIVGIGVYGTNGNAEFTTASPAFDAEVESANGNINAGYKIYNSSPSNHTVDAGDIQSNALHSGYLIAA